MTSPHIGNRARLLAIPAIGAAAFGIALTSRSNAQSTPTPLASPSPNASPVASPETGMPSAAGVPGTAATVTAGDLFFDPKELTIAAGTDFQVTVNNGGALAHDWKVRDQSAGTDLISPGATATATVNLPAGTYQYYCSVPGHAEAGMVGTLTVQ